jgi:ABC-type multidrug transport system ATPase subunit
MPTASAYENVELGLRLSGGVPRREWDVRIRRCLDAVGLSAWIDHRPYEMSGGQQQRLALARALVSDQRVVLFDEPLSGLDANAAWMIKDIVRGLADRGKTVLYCSHILDVVERLCERVIILDRGRVVADGLTSQLLSSSERGTLETLFRSLTAPEDQRELVGAFLGSFTNEK